MKPLCIDLFCGLLKSQFFRRADPLVQQFMASWAQNPDHVGFSVLHFPPCPIAGEFGPMGELQHAALTTRLARLREFRVLPSDPDNDPGIPVGAAGIVNREYLRVSLVEVISAVLGSLNSAYLRAVSAVAVWWLDLKVSPAYLAWLSVFSGAVLFTPAKPPLSRLAPERAILLINPACNEFSVARTTE